MFVVLATHNTGHGEVTNVIQLTRNIKNAVETARSVEKLDYEFFSREVGARIVQSKPERQPCRKNESRLILWRRHSKEHRGEDHTKACWTEEWFDKNLEKVVSGKME